MQNLILEVQVIEPEPHNLPLAHAHAERNEKEGLEPNLPPAAVEAGRNQRDRSPIGTPEDGALAVRSPAPSELGHTLSFSLRKPRLPPWCESSPQASGNTLPAQLVESGLREIFWYVLRLGREYEFDKSACTFEGELKEPIRKRREQRLTGDRQDEKIR